MKKLTKKQIEALANELRTYLLEQHLWIDVRIYFNGKAFSTSDGNKSYYNDPNHLVVLENVDPSNYTKYAGDILTMTFEGPLYDCLHYDGYEVQEALYKIFNKYGLYFEYGENWNLTAFYR